MSKLLEIDKLCKSYDSGGQKLDILSDLSLSLEEEEMVAITGVSGSGKSTLLHLIGGMDRPDQGSIFVSGSDITELNPMGLSAFRNKTIGFVFQFHHLLPEFTALENVMIPLLIRGESPGEAQKASRALLIDVGLENRGHHRPGELSGGEQQRIALARALAGNPRLLLADEPTGNLDPSTGETVGRLIQELHTKRRLTSIIVTHNESLARICTSVYRLEHGKLIDRS
jgi:lipoprotein-releasing system ATP-binding protein